MDFYADQDDVLDTTNLVISTWLTGDKFKATAREYTIFDGKASITYSGVNLEVDKNGRLIDGTIKEIVFNNGRAPNTLELERLRIDAEEFSAVVRSKSQADDKAFINTLLSKKDFVSASDEADTLSALKGDDFIKGNGGDDIIDGGVGNDRLAGGLGSDMLVGGKGTDTFMYWGWTESTEANGIDTILDFSKSDGDKISIDGAGYIGFEDLAITTVDGDTYISILIDVFAEPPTMTIKVEGEIAFTADDFVFPWQQ